jgi:hypothetical protein
MTDRGERPKQFTRSGVEVPPEPPIKINSRRGKRLRKGGRFRWEDSSASGTAKRRRRLPRQIFWYAFGVLAFIACAIACSIFLIRGIDPLARMEVVASKPLPETETEPPVPVHDPPGEPKDRAEAAIEELVGFVNDANHLERSARIFETEDIPLKLETFYGSRGHSLPKRIINPSVTAADFKGRELLFVAFNDESGRQWSAPFEWDRDRYRLHWEAMTGYGETSWQEFVSERPKGLHRMRLKLYLPEEGLTLSPDGIHLIGLISHPELAQPIGVLVKKNSPVHQSIQSLSQHGDVPALVGIEWPQTGGDYPIISNWLHLDWLR